MLPPSRHWSECLCCRIPGLQLSLGGKLATAFAALMDKLWRGGVGHVSPKMFK